MTSNEPATPATPWRGGVISVPAFLSGCPVIAAMALPTRPNEPSHRFIAILVDNGKQGGPEDTLAVALVSFGAGYRIRSKWTGYTSYQTAVADMLEHADIDKRTAEALATETTGRDEHLQELTRRDRTGPQQ